jgi:hypothetical protein
MYKKTEDITIETVKTKKYIDNLLGKLVKENNLSTDIISDVNV